MLSGYSAILSAVVPIIFCKILVQKYTLCVQRMGQFLTAFLAVVLFRNISI